MKNILLTLLLLSMTIITGLTQTSAAINTNTHINNHSSVNINAHANTSHHHNSHHHNASTKQHKINFNSGQIYIDGVGDLMVLSTTGNEVIIESEVTNHEQDKRAQGLKPLNSAGIEDNTGMGISAKVDGDMLTITQISNDCNCEGVKIYVPKSVKISISNKDVHANDIEINDIESEIIISTLYQNVTLTNVSGPMSVKSVYGNVEGIFKEVDQNGSITINAVYGFVDVSLPQSTKANLRLSASYGELLSDMNVEVEKEGNMQKLSSTKVKGTLNGGGVLIDLKSSYENVYLRSK